jgi:lycopene cyclase domain-containing protein
MEKASWTYAFILGLSLLYPLLQSFEKRVFMYKKMRYIFPGIGIAGFIFILWDVWFTRAEIWGFNHNFTRNSYFLDLPVEEWLFFLVVPYACIFLYEVLRYFVKKFYFPKASRLFIIFALLALIISLPLVYNQTYTLVAFSYTAFMLFLQLVQKTYKTWFSGFLLN